LAQPRRGARRGAAPTASWLPHRARSVRMRAPHSPALPAQHLTKRVSISLAEATRRGSWTGMADLYVQYERSPYFDRQSGMTLEVRRICCDRVGGPRGRAGPGRAGGPRRLAVRRPRAWNRARCVCAQVAWPTPEAAPPTAHPPACATTGPRLVPCALTVPPPGVPHDDRKVVLPVRGEPVLLHDRGADLRLLQPGGRGQARGDGPRQVSEDAVRLLLRRVRASPLRPRPAPTRAHPRARPRTARGAYPCTPTRAQILHGR